MQRFVLHGRARQFRGKSHRFLEYEPFHVRFIAIAKARGKRIGRTAPPEGGDAGSGLERYGIHIGPRYGYGGNRRIRLEHGCAYGAFRIKEEGVFRHDTAVGTVQFRFRNRFNPLGISVSRRARLRNTKRREPEHIERGAGRRYYPKRDERKRADLLLTTPVFQFAFRRTRRETRMRVLFLGLCF